MKTYNLCLIGFGNVGKAFVKLLRDKDRVLDTQYGIGWRITGIGTRRLGWNYNSDGLDVSGDDAVRASCARPAVNNMRDWLAAARADVLIEISSLNPDTGQPAIDHIRAALETGVHAITANKGPIVHAYRELRDLAKASGKGFLHEGVVMGGAPIFSLFREGLPATRLRRFRGILNSTSNVILTAMEEGMSMDDGLRRAQALGIAETDPSADIDGWDSTVKVCALATVLMDAPVKPGEVKREGIRGLSAGAVRKARAEGRPFKLVCQAERTANGVAASVRPEQVPLTDPLASVNGSDALIHFELDTIHGLTVREHDGDAYSTAFGLLADFINIVARD